jgi:hypothetical protein
MPLAEFVMTPSNRATMVSDLRALPLHPDREYWLKWITLGRPGSLMPSFAQAEGGPLNDDQIDSLVGFLLSNDFQRKPHLPATTYRRFRAPFGQGDNEERPHPVLGITAAFPGGDFSAAVPASRAGNNSARQHIS